MKMVLLGNPRCDNQDNIVRGSSPIWNKPKNDNKHKFPSDLVYMQFYVSKPNAQMREMVATKRALKVEGTAGCWPAG